MSVNENCPICPARLTCDQSIKSYLTKEGTQITIMGRPVECPGPNRLTRILDDNRVREFFGFVDPQTVLTESAAMRLKESLKSPHPTLTSSWREYTIAEDSVEEASPTSEL